MSKKFKYFFQRNSPFLSKQRSLFGLPRLSAPLFGLKEPLFILETGRKSGERKRKNKGKDASRANEQTVVARGILSN